MQQHRCTEIVSDVFPLRERHYFYVKPNSEKQKRKANTGSSLTLGTFQTKQCWGWRRRWGVSLSRTPVTQMANSRNGLPLLSTSLLHTKGFGRSTDFVKLYPPPPPTRSPAEADIMFGAGCKQCKRLRHAVIRYFGGKTALYQEMPVLGDTCLSSRSLRASFIPDWKSARSPLPLRSVYAYPAISIRKTYVRCGPM